MKIIFTLLLSSMALATVSIANCFVGIPDDCPTGKVCAKYNPAGDSRCVDIPKTAPMIFDLPFDESSIVFCTQSSRLSTATHVFQNMLYAIDLTSHYKSDPGKIYASAPGKAFVHSGCKNPAGKPDQTKTDDCGLGYGNHVFLLHDEGYISIYAHLSEVSVKTGDNVRARQEIGGEGATGQAAHRQWVVMSIFIIRQKLDREGHYSIAYPSIGGKSVYQFRQLCSFI